jgi:hypothetical protein
MKIDSIKPMKSGRKALAGNAVEDAVRVRVMVYDISAWALACMRKLEDCDYNVSVPSIVNCLAINLIAVRIYISHRCLRLHKMRRLRAWPKSVKYRIRPPVKAATGQGPIGKVVFFVENFSANAQIRHTFLGSVLESELFSTRSFHEQNRID